MALYFVVREGLTYDDIVSSSGTKLAYSYALSTNSEFMSEYEDWQRANGVKPVDLSMPAAELPTALQTGVIDVVVVTHSGNLGRFAQTYDKFTFYDEDGNVLSLAVEDTVPGTDNDDVLTGGDGDSDIDAGAGDDVLHGGAGANDLDGGDGLDTAIYDGARADFAISVNGSEPDGDTTLAVAANNGTINDTLHAIERVEFSDGTLAFDIEGNAGQAYRLYQAAFDRVPDKGGVAYWTHVIDGGASLHDVSQSFIDSAEFQGLYGDSSSNEQLVTLLYENVLDRAPDEGGLDYWTDRMDAGLSQADALIAFSESNENKANVTVAVDNGIWLA